ncbi:MAG: hypothetical protein COU07_00605 [Candidatus Harrisonbacteria bacterium CG10_big_fil_rev_8_21_14_0_10_40_38]|uniref:Uncharacterized protein n=1 Tax=Candidatus Harrisonbacteria bacterium CG10_big_fil_rev_8_21_14_0_10_40_38 TaxID=1974583 RepID=A0A2H0UUR2_9BACT|nr:MAG: hypothetical protein COU07_00605 [Candidatus Harrisonbacteria bacterium CG10_big_fil_rev_8_21_14_0_10_40_38]
MNKNPIINAFAASAYIVGIVLLINHITKVLSDNGDKLIIPILMLSLFTLSAAVMGFIFLFIPIQMYLDGKKKEGGMLLIKSVGAFAVITSIILIVALV